MESIVVCRNALCYSSPTSFSSTNINIFVYTNLSPTGNGITSTMANKNLKSSNWSGKIYLITDHHSFLHTLSFSIYFYCLVSRSWFFKRERERRTEKGAIVRKVRMIFFFFFAKTIENEARRWQNIREIVPSFFLFLIRNNYYDRK